MFVKRRKFSFAFDLRFNFGNRGYQARGCDEIVLKRQHDAVRSILLYQLHKEKCHQCLQSWPCVAETCNWKAEKLNGRSILEWYFAGRQNTATLVATFFLQARLRHGDCSNGVVTAARASWRPHSKRMESSRWSVARSAPRSR